MRCLGPAILNCLQVHNLDAGKPVLVERSDVFPDAAEKAVVGDLWWVKEEFTEYTPKFGGPPGVHEMVPGMPGRMKMPKIVQDYWESLRATRCPARQLPRSASRAYLRIGAISDKGFHCTPHMQNIDEFLAGKKAEVA